MRTREEQEPVVSGSTFLELRELIDLLDPHLVEALVRYAESGLKTHKMNLPSDHDAPQKTYTNPYTRNGKSMSIVRLAHESAAS
jgi:hypothetical protein